MAKAKKKALVADCIYADSEVNADQLYLTGFLVPDPFLTIKVGRKVVSVMSPLEISRARKESQITEVLSMTEVVRASCEWLETSKPSVAGQIAWLANVYHIDRFRIPADFPAGVLEGMRELGLQYEVVDAICPKREFKSDEEAKYIQEGNRCSAAGIAAAAKALKLSEIKRGYLYLNGKRLTSEKLHEIIEIACLEVGGVAMHPIAAGGDQGCDPHCRGEGPLKANQLIIVDVFPRIKKTGYHGDMTRTFLKGKASEGQKALVDLVKQGHQFGLDNIKARVSGKWVHEGIVKIFNEAGYPTEMRDGTPVGFFHGTGHGLGLAVHEAPRVSPAANKLKVGQVVTVEPGLYYPGLGGCRIEDVVSVTKDGCEMLSKAPYRWQIK